MILTTFSYMKLGWDDFDSWMGNTFGSVHNSIQYTLHIEYEYSNSFLKTENFTKLTHTVLFNTIYIKNIHFPMGHAKTDSVSYF